jgi:carboxymethylenebutenolidase
MSQQRSAYPPIPQEAFDWYDEYAHGLIDRRTFFANLGKLAVLGYSVTALSAALLPDYAQAEQVSFNDEAIKATYVTFDSPQGHGRGRGYLVQPKALEGKAPVVLVAHENRGLNPYIADVARRLAKVGYVAFAPDALYSLGGYPGNDDDGKALQKSLDRAKIEQDFIAAARFIQQHPLSSGKLGVVGFCFGGYISNMLAAALGDSVAAAVPFYGTPPHSDLIPRITAPLLLQFAELDQRVNATWPEYETALKQHNIRYQAHVYPAVHHGFHNDSTARYDQQAAELAWSRTLAFFATHLAS